MYCIKKFIVYSFCVFQFTCGSLCIASDTFLLSDDDDFIIFCDCGNDEIYPIEDLDTIFTINEIDPLLMDVVNIEISEMPIVPQDVNFSSFNLDIQNEPQINCSENSCNENFVKHIIPEQCVDLISANVEKVINEPLKKLQKHEKKGFFNRFQKKKKK